MDIEYIKKKYDAIKFSVLHNKTLTLLFLFGIAFELFIFFRLPKQAWVEGLLESWYTNNGLIFYKDFTNQYFPFLHMLMVPVHKIFGFTQMTTLILAPFNSLLVLLLLLSVSLKWLNGWRRLVPIGFFLLWDPILSQNHFSTAAFQETINFVSLILWFLWFEKPSKRLAFMIGLCLSASVFSLHISVFFAGAIFISMLFRALLDKRFFDSLTSAAIGFLIPVAFILLWFSSKNAVYDLLWWNIVYYIKFYPYANLGRGMVNVIMFFAVFTPVLIFYKLIYSSLRSKSFNKQNIKERKEFTKLISLSFILTTLPFSIWFAIFHIIRFQLALPIYAFALGYCLQLSYHKKFDKLTLFLIAGILVLNGFSVYYYMIPSYQSSFAYSRSHNIITKLYPDDPMFTAVEWIKNNTPKNARLFVLADPLFYFETERLPVNARGTMNQPFTYEPLSELSKEFRQKAPDYWVVDERLVHQRFHEYGYDHTIVYFDKLLNCDPIAIRIEYITIRKHEKNAMLCID